MGYRWGSTDPMVGVNGTGRGSVPPATGGCTSGPPDAPGPLGLQLNMINQIILVRCPRCGTLHVDQSSLMTLHCSNASAFGSKQECDQCRHMIELPDHYRSEPNTIHFMSGRGGAASFVVNLITGVSDLQNRNDSTAVQIDYNKLPNYLRPIWDIIKKHPKIATVVLGAIALWAQHLHETFYKHQLTLKEIDEEHANSVALEQLRHSNGKSIETLKHELELERLRLAKDMKSLESSEQEIVNWLTTMPQMDNADDDSIHGVLRVLNQFICRFNELNQKLQALKQAHKMSILANAGNATQIVLRPDDSK